MDLNHETRHGSGGPVMAGLSRETLDLAIRLGFIALLGYWSLKVIAPFVVIVIWSAIFAVALYPLYEWFARWLGHSSLAAALVTLLCLTTVIGPITWLGFGLISGIGSLVRQIDAGQLWIPLPPESLKEYALIGPQLHHLWSQAAANFKTVLTEAMPALKAVAGTLLELAQRAFWGLLEFLASIVVAGFLFPRAPSLVEVLNTFLTRILSERGREMVHLAGATIRAVSRGIIGIALMQAVLAGVGFLAAGIRDASVLAFIALLLGILQIGPSVLILPIVVWSWMTMETAHALLFTAYMLPVSLIDNVLRPMLLARGLVTPMPVIMIGVIGGIIAYGIVGLFLGPIVLAVAWAIMTAWLQDATDEQAFAPGNMQQQGAEGRPHEHVNGSEQ
jgi:predicted PurR-regulated permease PerM